MTINNLHRPQQRGQLHLQPRRHHLLLHLRRHPPPSAEPPPSAFNLVGSPTTGQTYTVLTRFPLLTMAASSPPSPPSPSGRTTLTPSRRSAPLHHRHRLRRPRQHRPGTAPPMAPPWDTHTSSSGTGGAELWLNGMPPRTSSSPTTTSPSTTTTTATTASPSSETSPPAASRSTPPTPTHSPAPAPSSAIPTSPRTAPAHLILANTGTNTYSGGTQH